MSLEKHQPWSTTSVIYWTLRSLRSAACKCRWQDKNEHKKINPVQQHGLYFPRVLDDGSGRVGPWVHGQCEDGWCRCEQRQCRWPTEPHSQFSLWDNGLHVSKCSIGNIDFNQTTICSRQKCSSRFVDMILLCNSRLLCWGGAVS